MKRSSFKVKSPKPLKRGRLRVKGHSEVNDLKDEIQRLVREIVMIRDGGCILRNYRRCGGELGQAVMQADHLITRSNSATYADTRLIVCLCQPCHGGWKKWHKEDYDRLVKSILSKDRVALWEACEADNTPHHKTSYDWKLYIIQLKNELKDLLAHINE